MWFERGGAATQTIAATVEARITSKKDATLRQRATDSIRRMPVFAVFSFIVVILRFGKDNARHNATIAEHVCEHKSWHFYAAARSVFQ
jgi:hypothetical protein